ncbi:SDR family NAD(P)-dependent oxidoreductase [Solirubrobacter ginsenosidimutans]|uniref:SDR family NAD(P)-dependent oxidoreductase n=1 Tax=Solirubrobacter ginsenosidimutans TaxID=490573 RepID=A0A9X3S5Q3_9ACTN|nr:SDR family NAD(P)-dependent oxidoreductase [Solirubrobacter ginsenosidimutans]MDA0164371.1 SDR family NAD(P)-dependent oxidoreductase [Solirubrobacter ginsenosidimutans]
MSADAVQNAPGAVDSRHLLVVGTGPGLGASVARRFAREGYRLTLVARSPATLAALADALRAASTDVTIVAADAGDPDRLSAALAPLFAGPGAPGVVIYSAALAASDELLSVTPQQLAAAYAVNVIGAVVTAQLAVPAMRAAGGGTLLFTGGGFADALPESLTTLSLGKLTLRGVATMLARQVRDDNIHSGSLTIRGQIAAGTPFAPDRIADAYWAIHNEDRDGWREEYRFDGAVATTDA